jgi:integrase/recombinase XerD
MHVILYLMTEVEFAGTAGTTVSIPAESRDGLMIRLTDGWLDRSDSVHTRTAYERDLRYWVGWCQERGLHPLAARTTDVDSWLAAQRDHGIRPGSPPASRRSVARRRSVVSSWYDYLIMNTAGDPQPLINHNPAAGARRPDVDRDHSPTLAISRAEADRLISAADDDGPRSSAIIRLMLTNAYRCASVIGAQADGLGHDRGHRVLTTTIKGGHIVRDPIPPATAAAIDAYLAARGDPAGGSLFVTRTGRPLDEGYLWKLVRRLARRAGIPAADNLSPHSLRRTAITEALDATGDLRKAQDLAHHADPRTTRLYDDGRGKLDGHAAYVLGTRYGVRRDA